MLLNSFEKFFKQTFDRHLWLEWLASPNSCPTKQPDNLDKYPGVSVGQLECPLIQNSDAVSSKVILIYFASVIQVSFV